LPTLLAGHKGIISSLQFSSDGLLLASGSGELWEKGDNTVVVWSLEAKPYQATILDGYQDGVPYLAFDPRKKQLATGSLDKTIRIWNTEDLSTRPEILHLSDAVSGLTYSDDGQFLFAGSSDGTLWMWSTKDFSQKPFVAEVYGWTGVNLASSITNNLLAVSGSGNLMLKTKSIYLLNTNTFEEPVILQGHEDSVPIIRFSSDGSILVSADENNTIRMWDMNSKSHESLVLHMKSSAANLSLSPDNNFLAVGDYNGIVQIWHLDSDYLSLNFAPFKLNKKSI
jgi:WD40 repeat protein